MALGHGLQLRQSQSLVMTPQLLQSIRLLQFTQFELDRFIDEEIERNPLLERAETEEAAEAEPQTGEPGSEDGVDRWFEASDETSAERIAGQLDTTLENVFPDEPGLPALRAPSGGGSGASDGAFDILDFAAGRPDLRQHVREQIAFVQDRAGHDRRYAIDASKIAGELGWSPSVGFDEGIARTVDWYLANGRWTQRILDGAYRLERLGQEA